MALQQKKLNELANGDKIQMYLLLTRIEIREGKTGKQYVYLEVCDKTSSINGNIWDNFNHEEIIRYQSGDVIALKGEVSEFNGNLQLRVHKINMAPDISVTEFIPSSDRPVEEMEKELRKFYNSITNPFLQKLIGNILFNKYENYNAYIRNPAGKSWHHAYLGGLLEHTLEIMKICDLMCTFHTELNRDLLLSGAIFHDFGKIIEISSEPGFEYSDEGKLLGHIVISAMLVDKEIANIEGFPKELRDQLVHLILSHQGKLEHASPVIPKTIEAAALYHADELSAKVNAYILSVQNNNTGGRWTKKIFLADTELYIPPVDNRQPEQQKTENNNENEQPQTLFSV